MIIVVGYPGIGKSTLCQHRENCIDLESTSIILLVLCVFFFYNKNEENER